MTRHPVREVTIVAHDIGGTGGGMERQLGELILGLLERGWQVTAIARRCDLPPRPGLTWVRVRGPARPFALGYLVFFLVGSWQVRRHRAGLVHTTGAIVANRADVCTIHACHLASHQHRRAALKAQPIAQRIHRGVSRAIALLGERLLYRRSIIRHFVAVSPGLAREVRECFPAIWPAISVIPNGVDQTVFRPDPSQRRLTREALGLADSSCVALFVGGDWERKGLPAAIEAVSAVDGWHLLVAGSGDAQAFQRLARRFGAENRVKFTGARADVERFYAVADVFLLPSVYETFSLATYEAAAAGLPLLVTRVSGVEDILVDGDNGWFISRDAKTIARRLKTLQKDVLLRSHMGARSQELVSRYTWSRVVDHYADLYAGLARAGITATRPDPSGSRATPHASP